MKKKKFTKVTIRQVLLEMGVGDQVIMSSLVTPRESIRVICSNLKKEKGLYFRVKSHDLFNYSVNRIS